MSAAQPGTGARPVVTVDGRALDARVAAALRTTVVDTDAEGPDSCRLVLDDPMREILRDSGIDLASALVVTAGRTGEDTGDRVFQGVVYAVGLEVDERGSFTVVTAYDRSYGLYNGLHTCTYVNVTDSDIASEVARRAGLQLGTVATTAVVHRHVSQVNETYIDFLTRRAHESGRVVVVTGDRLSFVEPTAAAGAPAPGDLSPRDRLQLVPGATVSRLLVRVTAAQQVGEVEVRGWDRTSKASLVATSSAATRAAELADTPATLADRLGGRKTVTVDVPLDQQAECDAVAAARADRLGGTAVHAEGVAEGDPRLLAGRAVSLGQTGGRFDGKVTLTRARHVWDDRGYRTHFTASGAHDRSLLGLVGHADGGRSRDRVPGVVVGVVTNVADPDSGGRVRLRFPWLDDDYETDWARVLQLGAGDQRGLQLLPEVDDEVLVGFEHGDTRRPYVLGGLYNGVDKPPRTAAVDAGGKVARRVWRSRSGHEVELSDEQGEERVTIRTGGDAVTLVMSATDGALTLTTKGDVTVDASGKATVRSTGDLVVESRGSATLKGATGLTLESGGDVTIKGTVIRLN